MGKVPRPILCLILAGTCLAAPSTEAAITERVSLSSTGEEGDGGSEFASVSADGRFVAFASEAGNLVPGDTHGWWQVYLRHRLTGTTEIISVSSLGQIANGVSYPRSISPDGRFIAFDSGASNLVPSDTNGWGDCFIHDRQTGTVERVSLSSAGEEANSGCGSPSVGADGRYVAFHSGATNLVPGLTGGWGRVFVRDRVAGTTRLVSVSTGGAPCNGHSDNASISADGRYVAFGSDATNLVPADSNDARDIFVHDTVTGSTQRVSVSSAGVQANWHSYGASISQDGRYVAFHSEATNLVDLDYDYGGAFVHDRLTGTTEMVSVSTSGEPANCSAFGCSISGDGNYVAFASAATNLCSSDTNGWADVFVRDRLSGITTRVSVSTDGAEGNDESEFPSVSPDGRCVAFRSKATNLVTGDTNGATDVFVREWFDAFLSSGYVIPSTGDAATKFTYRAKYWNTASLLPAKVWVAVWSSGSQATGWREMWEYDPSDRDTLDGKWYTYSCYLGAGDYAYRFAARTGGAWVYWPKPAGTYNAGPTVVPGNPAVLSSGYVTPTSGSHATDFTWRVKYWHTGNLPPDEIYVGIWFPAPYSRTYWYGMWAYDAADTNYKDGKWYTFNRRWLPPGTYAYRFAARQGSDWAYWPKPAGSYQSGPTVNP